MNNMENKRIRDPARRLARVLELAIAAMLVLAVTLNFGNVIGRYLLGAVFAAADELQVYLMIGMAFLGTAAVTARNVHLRMDVIQQRFPQHMRRWAAVVEMLLICMLAGLVVYVSGDYVIKMYQFGAVSENAHIPMWIPHGAVVLGFLLTACVAVFRLSQLVAGTWVPADETDEFASPDTTD